MKKMKVWLLLILPVLFSGQLLGQEAKKKLSLKDAIIGRWTYLYPEHIEQLHWLEGAKGIYVYQKDNGLVKQGIKGDATGLVSLSDLQESNEKLSSLESFPTVKWSGANSFTFVANRNYFKYDLSSKKSSFISSLPEGGANQELSPDHNHVAYTIGNNLYIGDANGQKAISNENNKGIVFGQAVHRFEFGIEKGTFWSPKSNFLAFYRKDETMVTDYPLVDINTHPATVNNIKYPMAGMKSHHVRLGIYNVATGDTVFVKTGEPKEQYLTNVAWGPEEKFIYIAVLNRAQNHLKLNQYDVATGDFVKTILEEKDDKYLSILHPMMFVPNSPNEFLWRSERNGYEHIYRYNLDGTLLNQVTSGDWIVTDIIGFDKTNKKVILVGSDNFGMDRVIYQADIKKGGQKKISQKSGTYSHVQYEKNSKMLLTSFTANDVQYTASILDANGKEVKNLLTAANTLKDYTTSPIELFQIKADDGTPLNCRMIKPSDFDASKKYPVIVYVYNGPGVQLIQNTWQASAPLWMQYAAQRGYIVFTVDGRGSENRGKAFEQATHLHLGDVEIKDQLKGVEYLKGLSYVDADKMAVHGWSFGGFMTTSLMLKSPDTFKVGVAGGAVMDWSLYEIMYTERYMSTPQQNEEGYANANLLDKVSNLKGKLLLIHDTGDDVVVPQHAYKFLQSCVQEGVQLDYFTYPMHGHNVRGKDRIHLIEKVLDYIDSHLNN
ncbi:DPP IV N-terminal domain-containing protein [Limibacter armeniacum]|uniref:S9 family peptidase n=1 Tax=Limibacter armeniacum TaxID=466084 RepID=UPI002FE54A0F